MSAERRKGVVVLGIVSGIAGVQHNPALHRRLQSDERSPRIIDIQTGFDGLRSKIASADPDTLLIIGNDHLHQFFLENMPQFLLAKPSVLRGPFPDEIADFGLPHYTANVDLELANEILTGALREGIDLGYSNECMMDHAFTMPLHYLRPGADLPVVALFSNVMAPPFPPASRFFEVGRTLRKVIESTDVRRKVVVIGSGHLSVELGGPHAMNGPADLAYDERIMGLIKSGDVDGLLAESAFDRMIEAGNLTSALLNFVLLMGIADGAAPAVADLVISDTSSTPFIWWDCQGAENLLT
jgi:protocatechuate 4,5-dioxygenase beta chain